VNRRHRRRQNATSYEISDDSDVPVSPRAVRVGDPDDTQLSPIGSHDAVDDPNDSENEHIRPIHIYYPNDEDEDFDFPLPPPIDDDSDLERNETDWPGLIQIVEQSRREAGIHRSTPIDLTEEKPEDPKVREARLKRGRENEAQVRKKLKAKDKKALNKWDFDEEAANKELLMKHSENFLKFLCPVCTDNVVTMKYKCEHFVCETCVKKVTSLQKACPTCKGKSVPKVVFTPK
jgi:hypothetical protein